MPTHFPNVAAANGNTAPKANVVPPPLPTSWQFAQYIRQPGDPITRQRFEFVELSRVVREHLTNQIGTHTRDEAARMLWVQGRPGEGKSEGTLVASINAGFHAIVAASDLFAGEEEGASTKKLYALLAEMERWSAAHQCRVVVIFDDFDLSTANVDDNAGHTINSQLLVNAMMALADNRHLYRNVDGSNISFIITVNDATGMRESLTRSGRAIWHEHCPSPEDKSNIAWAILAPKTSAERELVHALVRKNIKQPVAFWKALYFKMRALHAHRLTAGGMPSQRDVDVAYGQRMPLTPEIAWEAAKQLRATRVKSYLRKRGKSWWSR